jgi:quercetin dioxygenase-like cupin family protein
MACLVSVWACAQQPAATPAANGQQVVRASISPPRLASLSNFTGRAGVTPLFGMDPSIPASGAYVTFEPGARTAWHIHPAGQRLVVIAGLGLTQEWGKPVQELRPGDVVVCPAGIKHWHGAAATSQMTHLAITGAVAGKAVQWMEAVSDVEYNAR